MMRTWTEIGKEYTKDNEKAIEGMIDRLKWQELPCETSFMAGEGIKEAIKQFKIPNVSHIAESSEMAPYGLYGIKAHYQDGDGVVYLVDDGLGLTPIASDFTPKKPYEMSSQPDSRISNIPQPPRPQPSQGWSESPPRTNPITKRLI